MDGPTTTTSGTKPTAERRTLALGTRIFLITGVLIALAVGAAIALTSLRADQIARDAVAESLIAARTAMSAYERQRYAQLGLMSRLVAGDPNFVAYVAESDAASVRDLLEERRAGLGCDFAMVIDREGRVLARTDRGGALDASARALAAAAAARGEASGVLREGDRLYYAAAVPLVVGAEAFGLLVAGFEVNDERALEMKRLGATEVAYLAGTSEPRVVASTLGAGASELARALTTRREALRRALESPGAAPFEIQAEGRRWEVLAEPLRDGAGAPVGALLGLASLDQRLAPFRRIISALIGLGLITVAVAFALSWAISRRVTRPLEELAAAAEAARAGRFERGIETGRNDEIGRLARAFDGLLSDLREKRDMEVFVTRLARNLPEPPSATPISPARDGEPLAPGTLFAGRFEVQSVLGTGGMGIVYKARDRELDDLVALKTLRPGMWHEPEALERLKSELRLARRITHPNVLRTFDFGESDGHPFISMEYVRGVTLRYLLDQTGRLPYSAGLRVARQLCAGLEAAHAVGVLHRDIKPENLIVEQTGGVKLMDFGIARPTIRGGGGPTLPGALIGTPRYMAPEQLQGRELDARSDLYACGVVMYETFTGAVPFAGADAYALIYRQMNERPTSPRVVQPDLPVVLETILLRCLEPDPANRHASARALLDELEGLRG